MACRVTGLLWLSLAAGTMRCMQSTQAVRSDGEKSPRAETQGLNGRGRAARMPYARGHGRPGGDSIHAARSVACLRERGAGTRCGKNRSGRSSLTCAGIPRVSQLQTRCTPPCSYPRSSATLAGPPSDSIKARSVMDGLHTMFIQSVNGACKPRLNFRHKLPAMHDSMRRLLDFARRNTEHRRTADRVQEFSDISRRLGVSSAVMTNWKARGISKDGALDAQQAFGCNAWWVLSGTGPQSVDGWPFPLVDRKHWDAADEAERGYIQHAIKAAFAEIERQRLRTADAISSMGHAKPIPARRKPGPEAADFEPDLTAL